MTGNLFFRNPDHSRYIKCRQQPGLKGMYDRLADSIMSRWKIALVEISLCFPHQGTHEQQVFVPCLRPGQTATRNRS